ncbi:MAG: dicarboxylate/amino acid:cation symporter [Deltaproteobacteria bacterium]|nr:dicarboxylate/amino acid:cation symporter [Deltaproteobacteria bacterium]
MRAPLYLQIIAAVVLAVVLGITIGAPLVPLGDLGGIVIRLLKLLATPLVFFAVIEAFVTTDIPPAKGARLVAISILNAVVATILGLSVAHVLGAGTRWLGHIDALLGSVGTAGPASRPAAAPTGFVDTVVGMVPKHMLEPFMASSIIPVMIAAVAIGLALRRLRRTSGHELQPALATTIAVVRVGLAVCATLLHWLIALVPLAVLVIVAAVVAKTGAAVFAMVGWFLATVSAGLFLHVLVYYPLLLVVWARRSPLRFFRGALDSIVTALSVGSSLASLPVTLRCLRDNLKVQDDSARLAACVGTNLNHDGIILYEAAAAIFVTQALGYDLSLGQQLVIAGTSIMAGVGIAGVPEAGLITLPLVLGAAGVPDAAVIKVIPLLFTVDWLIGRMRAATNVTSDMIVAVLIDRPQSRNGESAPAE